jgi:hypothetical protein
MGTVLSYGLRTGLGFARTVKVYTNDGGRNVLARYRHALYLGISMFSLAMIITLAFVRVPKDIREGWDKNDTSTPSTGEVTNNQSEGA